MTPPADHVRLAMQVDPKDVEIETRYDVVMTQEGHSGYWVYPSHREIQQMFGHDDFQTHEEARQWVEAARQNKRFAEMSFTVSKITNITMSHEEVLETL